LESLCQPVALVHRSVDPSPALNVTSRLDVTFPRRRVSSY
jgi:hypothetical protein